jgi:hypothetical protein
MQKYVEEVLRWNPQKGIWYTALNYLPRSIPRPRDSAPLAEFKPEDLPDALRSYCSGGDAWTVVSSSETEIRLRRPFIEGYD